MLDFDASQLEQTLHQDEVTLKQAEATIGNTRATTEQMVEKDKTALLKAQFTLEQDELNADEKEILAKIDGEEDQLKVVDDQQAVVEVEFSDYRPVSGVLVPFHIQKFIQHSLLLNLHVT